jgi:DNA-binding CsgD family transcriptional regulator
MDAASALHDVTEPRTRDCGGTVDDNMVAAAYSLLLKQPRLEVDQCAARLGCSEEAVRSILNRLTELALLRRRQSDSPDVEAVSPMVAMQRLIAREQGFLKQRHQFLRQTHETFSSIYSAYTANATDPDGEHLAERLTGLPGIRRRIEELTACANKEILSMCPAMGSSPALWSVSGPVESAVLARGVEIRSLYDDALAFNTTAQAHSRWLAGIGASVRILPRLPMRAIVIDGETAVIPGNPRNAADGALVIRHESMVLALTALFDATWAQGRPLLADDESEAAWTPHEQAIVRILASGAKDDAAARQLGTSVRTLRRVIANLMARAGVESRFALGIYAAAHNLL